MEPDGINTCKGFLLNCFTISIRIVDSQSSSFSVIISTNFLMILNISMEVKQLKIIVNATVLDNSLDY